MTPARYRRLCDKAQTATSPWLAIRDSNRAARGHARRGYSGGARTASRRLHPRCTHILQHDDSIIDLVIPRFKRKL